jgi:hypothetical protein
VERVTFVLERTGARVSCLLNPEALEARRAAGVVRRRGAGGAVLGNPRPDDPLIATGGGVTEYDLKLLFDVDIANEGRGARVIATPPVAVPPPESVAPIEPIMVALTDSELPPPPAIDAPAVVQPEPAVPLVIDVRALTQPLWAFAETGDAVDGAVAPQRVRFIWGKSWNIPGVVLAVAERLERFDAYGVPKRSWLSLRLRRVEEATETSVPPPAPTTPQFEIDSGAAPADDLDTDTIAVPVDPDGFPIDRLDQVAGYYYNDPALARAIAEYNDLDDLLRFREGDRLRMPRRAALQLSV